MNRGFFVLAWLGLLSCGTELDPTERATLAGMRLRPEELPASPTNAHADDPAAAALGRRLFGDRRLSSDGTVACVSCHDPSAGWSDPRERSLGVEGRLGRRHSMPVTNVAFQRAFLWDGRADSAWMQPLLALQNEKEMNLAPREVAELVRDSDLTEGYAAVFGAPPADDDRIFANVGKALEAYERRLTCAETRFDRWMRGEIAASEKETEGAAAFIENGCVACHSGPAFSDGLFHAIGLDGDDDGSLGAVEALRQDRFNGAGAYSDDPTRGKARIDDLARSRSRGAFRTPSLRGVHQRSAFGHTGRRVSLRDFLDDTYDDPKAGLDPLLDDVRLDDLDQLLAFLEMLDCPAVTSDLAP